MNVRGKHANTPHEPEPHALNNHAEALLLMNHNPLSYELSPSATGIRLPGGRINRAQDTLCPVIPPPADVVCSGILVFRFARCGSEPLRYRFEERYAARLLAARHA